MQYRNLVQSLLKFQKAKFGNFYLKLQFPTNNPSSDTPLLPCVTFSSKGQKRNTDSSTGISHYKLSLQSSHPILNYLYIIILLKSIEHKVLALNMNL
jgi:hypothetical protein